jgi:transposase
MIRAMIAGQRDPQALAGLARTRMKAKHDALAEALAGLFTDHHAELAQLLLDQIAFLGTQIARLTMLTGEQLASTPRRLGHRCRRRHRPQPRRHRPAGHRPAR